MVYKFFDKMSRNINAYAVVDKISVSAIKSNNISSQQLAGELHKLIIRKFKKCKLHSSLKDNKLDAGFESLNFAEFYN